MDIFDFPKQWGKEQLDAEANQQFWDSRAANFNEKAYQEDDKKHFTQMMDLFRQHHILHKDSCILDIGCGPGKYAIAFAKEVNKVIGIDISSKMINYATENARKGRTKNATFQQYFWEHIDLKSLGWEKQFDLVFASMCPGISNVEELKKMVKASRGYCFLSGFINKKNTFVDDTIGQIIEENVEKTRGEKIYYSFNTLWQWGYYPEIRYIEKQWENSWSIDEFVEQHYLKLKMNNVYKQQKESENRVYQYAKKVDHNGKIKQISQAKIGWLFWKV